MDGIVHATFVDLKDESLLSPDTSEFVTLERQILEQQPNFIIGSETGSATSEAPQSPHSMLLKFRFSEQGTRILLNRPIDLNFKDAHIKVPFACLSSSYSKFEWAENAAVQARTKKLSGKQICCTAKCFFLKAR